MNIEVVQKSNKVHFIAFISGALFGVGLAISQMINPQKVLAFLDVVGDWDPSLFLVIAAATGFTMLSFRLVLRSSRPVFTNTFSLPTKQDIGWQLIFGAAIFGMGWGLAGYCPGPALAALSIGTCEPVIFIISMVGGSFVYKWL